MTKENFRVLLATAFMSKLKINYSAFFRRSMNRLTFRDGFPKKIHIFRQLDCPIFASHISLRDTIYSHVSSRNSYIPKEDQLRTSQKVKSMIIMS